MRVCVLGFGSVWRRRLGQDPEDPRRFARAAYYNTTGVVVDGRLRKTPVKTGLFNAMQMEITSGLTNRDVVALQSTDGKQLGDGLRVTTAKIR